MKFEYLTCCVNSTAEKIDNMVEIAKEITFSTFALHCNWQEWAKAATYSIGSEKGLHLKDDWAVSFCKSVYDGQKCYYINHSRIEHIFTAV